MEKCAFDNGSDCIALECKECSGCRFYKTQEVLDLGRRKTEERLNCIRGGVALYKKYYAGRYGFKY